MVSYVVKRERASGFAGGTFQAVTGDGTDATVGQLQHVAPAAQGGGGAEVLPEGMPNAWSDPARQV